ncbi:Murein DD-endopeptidase MepM and murein hydrolase activator NlpD, contain LysM domain [Clostridium amylolyticum]|uniref:Murein DD-endopeptidase MepM and murein hydrolase activator NlpD, contain LysM domain n=1 Tax=Clostridium amylolyticum TaxID=1121298 RepID=A0A1M6MRH4_9CLOT|nr:peptidoglycan DD-metalloendopeptidase family protein [Clostridium amylolyticum]SHJ86044.1 Murein DD-endopeptidase MepM and murein hydrolase activator NlpD, contain LysM domain [Clostridium amylolyticum]
MSKKYLSIMVASIILCTQISVVQAAPDYIEDKQKNIEQNKEKMKQLEGQKNEVNNNKNAVKSEIDIVNNELEEKASQIAASETKINQIQSKINEMQNKIDVIQDNINTTENKINEIKKNIEEKEAEKKSKEELLGKRLRSMYKNNPYDEFLLILLNSKNLGDLISRAATISRIVETDMSLINKVKSIQLELDKDKELLSKKVEDLNAQKSQVSMEQNSVQATKLDLLNEKKVLDVKAKELKTIENEKQSKYNSLNNEEKKLQKEISSLDNINDELQKQMDKFINELNEKREKEENANKEKPPIEKPTSPDKNSGFIRPTNGILTSPFGMRMHPVYNEMRMHKGIDLASPKGTPIKASKSGVVDFAGVMSGYGNVVIVNHGNGYQTLYAHCNSLLVSRNQSVNQGQVIATVGNTGVGTGDHLHFEVRINGDAVNPLNYIK